MVFRTLSLSVCFAIRDADAACSEPIIRGLEIDVEIYHHAAEVLANQVQQAKAETDAISYTQGVLDGGKKAAREIINTLQAYTVERPNTGKVRIILDYGYWQSLKSKYMEGK